MRGKNCGDFDVIIGMAMKKLRLEDLYLKLVEAGVFGSNKPREFLLEALNRVECGIKENKAIIIRAPPGIGKTAISMTAALHAVIDEDPDYLRVIHVVPTRSLIEDIMKRVSAGFEKLVGEEMSKGVVRRQYSVVHETPFLSGLFVVTTYDTYFYNIAKISPSLYGKLVKGHTGHYEIPRASQLSSLSVFDEVHLILEEDESAAQHYLSVFEFLSKSGSPLLIMTATLPWKLLEGIKES
ncbi:DEAD/DEAH box helicase, partial [Infirmifilum sp.]|uniref:DEAD/DEAH box helicase n=1 Tax=Infirmifilum sp. TaxID=2856575 RepID=UPI003D0D2AE2